MWQRPSSDGQVSLHDYSTFDSCDTPADGRGGRATKAMPHRPTTFNISVSHIISSPTTHSCRSPWKSTTPHQPLRGSPTAQLLFGLGSCGTICNSTRTSQTPSSLEQHLSSDWLLLSEPAGRTQAEVARCNNRFAPAVRLPCQRRRNWACNYYTRALRHVRSLLSDDLAQTVACSIVASRLDYCNAVMYGAPADRHHLRRPATGSEQFGQSRLSARRSNRR